MILLRDINTRNATLVSYRSSEITAIKSNHKMNKNRSDRLMNPLDLSRSDGMFAYRIVNSPA